MSTNTDELNHLIVKIDDGLIECADGFGGNGTQFLPEDKMQGLNLNYCIRNILTVPGEEFDDGLAVFILEEAKRTFLTLASIRKVSAIIELRSLGFSDRNLPLNKERRDDPEKRRAVGSLDRDTGILHSERWSKVFEEWDFAKVDNFYDTQWRFLTPSFRARGDFLQRFDRGCLPPFIKKDDSASREGQASIVHKVTIHHAHTDFNPKVVALKSFKKPGDYFRKEMDMLISIKNLRDNHLIKPLAAFDNDRLQCVLFPWCEGGNLQDYWRRDGEPRDDGLILWTLSQIAGLCDCLASLSSQNIRHGDLKPQNILYQGNRKNFLIADIGISKIHFEPTNDRTRTSTTSATRRHAAPEFWMDGPLSRDFDVWSMGSIIYEWLYWLLYGLEGLAKLETIQGQFWDGYDDNTIVARNVQDSISRMRKQMNQDPSDNALKDLLHLVEQRLLVVELEGQRSTPSNRVRAKAAELSSSMKKIKTKAYANPSYRCSAKMWKTQTPLGGYGTRDPPASQQTRSPRPDAYEEKGEQLDDAWKPQLDDEFGRQVQKELGRAFIKTSSRGVTLCDSCKGLDVWSPNFELCYDILALDKSKACSLCALLLQCLLDNAEYPRVGKLKRDGSSLGVETAQTPLVSIYIDIASDPNTSFPAQIGFPKLLEPGSPAQSMLLRMWLKDCDKNHECSHVISHPSDPQMPRRLLDVGSESESSLRLVDTEKKMAKYIALSHCWGNVPKAAKFCTYKHNIRIRKEGIDFDELPRTFQDAVKVTRGLGIQYLWVDSVCIIQEDMDDWSAHAGGMETIFSSAYCTIAASSAASYLDGFLHCRDSRPCVAVQNGGCTLHFCKWIDNFHHDVEEAVLNKRGWVLQERVLSRRTIHFTSSQIYWECGRGVRCETLARLHNSKAGFLGDSDFPNYALQYFREGRIVLFQTLYKMYSRLAFSEPTDRSMGIIGLERRLARTFQTDGDYGILKIYLCRSLMWKRDESNELSPIEYPDNRTVPSWSWMAYSGAISYVDAPFDGVDWKKEEFEIFFKDGRLRNQTTQARAGKTDPEVRARAKDIVNDYETEILDRIVFDQGNDRDLSTLRCVVFGIDKEGDQNKRNHYVMVIMPCSIGNRSNLYRRVGAGSLLKKHISTKVGESVFIR